MQDDIDQFIATYQDWKFVNDTLKAEKKFDTFVLAIDFVNKVAELAEKHNHHPDMLIQYNKVALTLSSHDAGNKVTEKDILLAKAIESL